MYLTEEEKEVIEKQIGRIPRGAIKIVKYTKDNEPLVLLTNPILPDESPFPTIYYLTHPQTVEVISRLEENGLIKELEDEIKRDLDLAVELTRAHEEYIQKRLSLIGDALHELTKSKRDVIEKTGVGGVKDFKKIKCLHAHYAHYLVGSNNPIGRRVQEKLDEKSCD